MVVHAFMAAARMGETHAMGKAGATMGKAGMGCAAAGETAAMGKAAAATAAAVEATATTAAVTTAAAAATATAVTTTTTTTTAATMGEGAGGTGKHQGCDEDCQLMDWTFHGGDLLWVKWLQYTAPSQTDAGSVILKRRICLSRRPHLGLSQDASVCR
jgi:hypothetical protein